jgi:sterol desaturase/sphingolipid hydroxylase (fatty acid hydroxylase superfamily)
MLKFIIRSPHLLEVLVAYGGVHIFSIYHLISFGGGLYDYLFGLFIGGILYTFIEYWFHRYLLHTTFLKSAHQNHHRNPIKLKIIATPLIPVQIYEFIIIISISIISSYWANMFQIGISVSQIIMDYVHYLEHSCYNPWFLTTAKSYHKLHHSKFNYNNGFGLTCPFWDTIFNTSVMPIKKEKTISKKYTPWKLYIDYPFLYYTQIPLPMINFILWTPFMNKSPNDKSAPMPNLKDVKPIKLLIALLSSIVVGNAPIFLDIFRYK